MSQRVRHHRRRNGLVDGVFVVVLMVGGLCGLIGLRVALLAFSDVAGGWADLLLFGVIGLAATAVWWWRQRIRRRAAQAIEQWERTAGWEPVLLGQRWPWVDMVRWAETVTVLRAYRKPGLIVGLVEFAENGLGAAVDRHAGRAAFAIVTLARPAPTGAVRVYREVAARRRGEDEFRRRFRVIGGELSPALQRAHVDGEVPAWTCTGDQMFVFVPLDGPLWPWHLERAAAKARRVVELSAVEVGEDG
ncbi:hypothetical protein [Actinoplanes friuliensis]|nr:hypothetical protein [Actinoplanes friuliensis]